MLFYIIGKNLRISLFLFTQELDISFCQLLQIPLKPFHLIEKVFDDMGCEIKDAGSKMQEKTVHSRWSIVHKRVLSCNHEAHEEINIMHDA